MEKVGLIPCAGRGSRLSLPFSKEMFPDVHQSYYSPIILHTIETMRDAGIEHLIFTINPLKTDLLKYLGNGKQFGLNFSYCIHPEPKSLAHSINEAYHLIKDKTVAFAMPDTIIQPSSFMKQLIKYHEDNQDSKITLGCFKTDKPWKFGMVKMKNNLAEEIIDKPKSTSLEWMWGTIIWEPECTEQINQFIKDSDEDNSKELILSDTFKRLLERKHVYCCCFNDGQYKDLGTYDEINDWSNNLLKNSNDINDTL